MRGRGRLGLLGGTFDPIHNGHLAGALAAREALGLERVHLIPAYVPPHRPMRPQASAEHRFAMVALGIAHADGLIADDRELRSGEVSFTTDTLARLAAEGWERSQLFFVTGADAFAEIATWRHYPALLDQAHFVVVSRAGRRASSLRAEMPSLADRMRDVSAGAQGGQLEAAQPVIWLIDAETPEVSATGIRDAVAAGRPIAGLTPSLVEQHILRHGLYRPGSRSHFPAAPSHEAADALHEQEPA